MSSVIIFNDVDTGRACIMYPVTTIEEALETLPLNNKGKKVTHKIMPISEVPQDREFRDAWQLKSSKIDIDIAKAKEIKKEKLRAERKPLLAALDVEFQRALEEGQGTAVIVAKKNKLRDITKEVDNVTTVEDLKAIKVE